MKIIFSGGGTLGPVTPLLAMHEVIQTTHPDARFVWIGTKKGPERELVEKNGILYISIVSGKLRRYVSLLNIIDPFRVCIGFLQSLRVLWHENPDVCITAGGFVSVPVHIAAWFLGIPTWVHSQDVRIGLANRMMAPLARIITTSIDETKHKFPQSKTIWLGNPVRKDIFFGNRTRARKQFGLTTQKPVVLVLGGGTGSMRINQLIVEAVPHLEGVVEVIHLSGRERPQENVSRAGALFPYYHMYQFLGEELKDAYAVASVIVCRGGFGTLTEAAALEKACIIIPKPGHQFENVRFLERARAALFVDERLADGLYVAKKIKELVQDHEQRQLLGHTLHTKLKVAEDSMILQVLEKVIRE